MLYVVATPIGNRGDISQRAVDVLRGVDVIAAEDTRHSRPLLAHLGIATPLIALHEHNERRLAPRLLRRLEAGESVALISDAGTPLISDPGYPLVERARGAAITVVPVPGPCALVCALSASGLPSERFVFEGFLPAKGPARRARLGELGGERRTLIFYESSHRIGAMLADLREGFGPGRGAVVARELTKKFETIRGGSLAELCEWIASAEEHRRGEFVVLVRGAEPAAGEDLGEQERVLGILLETLGPREAATLAARITGGRRNPLYRRALELRGEAGEGVC